VRGNVKRRLGAWRSLFARDIDGRSENRVSGRRKCSLGLVSPAVKDSKFTNVGRKARGTSRDGGETAWDIIGMLIPCESAGSISGECKLHANLKAVNVVLYFVRKLVWQRHFRLGPEPAVSLFRKFIYLPEFIYLPLRRCIVRKWMFGSRNRFNVAAVRFGSCERVELELEPWP